MDEILVLLAAYNGEKYIADMIDSVLNQDHKNIKIVLSDDNSSDSTLDILEDYANRYPEKIIHYKSGERFGNAQSHFMHLLTKFNNSKYIMFCDQDDIWHKDKVSRTLRLMKQLENERKIPVLVHTDLHVVDQELREISPSFCKYSNIDGNRVRLNQIIVHNVVTGCTVMINECLAKMATAKPIPMEKVVMHDWWIAILAACCGKIGFLDEKTIEYRQHNNNTVGAKNVRSIGFLLDWLKSRKMKKSMERCVNQAQAFLGCYSDVLPEDKLQLIKAFVSTSKKGIIGRDIIYLKYKIHKYGLTRILAQFLGL